jgi:MtN3 and saliva related transmembrane protein
MMMPALVIATGTIAGFCTTVAYVPQAVKTWRQGGRDLSYGMLVLYLTGVVLWLLYGLLIRAEAIIVTNVVTAVLIAIIMVLKAWREKVAPAPRDVAREFIEHG